MPVMALRTPRVPPRAKITPLIIALDQAQSQPEKSDRRRRRTRAALLEAAQTLFSEQHYEAVSIEQITEMADVAKASFYNHFPDKETLVNEIFMLVHGHVASLVDQDIGANSSAAVRLVRGCFITLRFGLEHRESAAALYRFTRDLLSLESPLNDRARNIIAAGLADGTFSEAGAEDGAFLVIGGISILIQQAVEGDLAGRVRLTAERVMAGLLRAFGVTPGRARKIVEAASEDLLAFLPK